MENLSALVEQSRFPPSFDGNPWSYGFALFSLTLLSAVSLTILTSYLLDAKAKREVNAWLHNEVKQANFALRSPLTLHRQIVSGLLLTIFLGAFPDVLVLLAWGETSDGTMEVLFALDRLCDGAIIAPFLWSVLLSLCAGQALDHRLGLEVGAVELRVSWQRLRERLRMTAVVFMIAVGVTVAKSVA